MNWGNKIHLTVFGESHGPAIGAVLEGLPAGEVIDMEKVMAQMARRAPGHDITATPRYESDEPKILSGFLNGKTTGAPLCAVIQNSNTHSEDYKDICHIPRPGHSDYPAMVHYHGFNDIRGGGSFSGRLTAPAVFAGAVCRQILRRRGIEVGAHVLSIHGVSDTPFDPVNVSAELLEDLSSRYFPTIDHAAENTMRAEIAAANKMGDSIGGVVECAAVGIPAGSGGGPLSDGIESVLSSLLFAIPACKGVEFGAGFHTAELFGSEDNDTYYYDGKTVKTRTNNAGGILGGISTGMPIVFRTAFKPTPSIAREQESIDLSTKQTVKFKVHGRHDPCIVPRAVPVVESAAAIALLDMLS